VNGKLYGGWTALHRACMYGHRDIAELLLDNGADIEARCNISESTPLMVACRNGYRSHSTIKLLLDRGCAINAAGDDGDTALHACALSGSTECVKELLGANGVNTSIKNKYGKTPFDVAKEKKNQAIIDLLMEHKKRVVLFNAVVSVVASKLHDELSSEVGTIINHHYEELFTTFQDLLQLANLSSSHVTTTTSAIFNLLVGGLQEKLCSLLDMEKEIRGFEKERELVNEKLLTGIDGAFLCPITMVSFHNQHINSKIERLHNVLIFYRWCCCVNNRRNQ
jgi:hypothetical protein